MIACGIDLWIVTTEVYTLDGKPTGDTRTLPSVRAPAHEQSAAFVDVPVVVLGMDLHALDKVLTVTGVLVFEGSRVCSLRCEVRRKVEVPVLPQVKGPKK